MKYLKLFDVYSNDVKLELSKDDCDDILDLFQTHIADKYQMAFFPHNKNLPNPNDDDFVCSYRGSYMPDDKYFELLVYISNINTKEFIRDMKKFKERLIKFGFEAKGHYWKSHLGLEKKYYVVIYKPMFTAKK